MSRDLKPWRAGSAPRMVLSDLAFGTDSSARSPIRFQNRIQAGILLSERLQDLRGSDTVILALPRGGVIVADPIAQALGTTLDVLVVRKLGVLFQPELAMGAIGEEGVLVLDESIVRATRTAPGEIEDVARRERNLLEARIAEYRLLRPQVPVQGRPVVIVDDGMATGATMRAACQVLTARKPGPITVAVPVAAQQAIRTVEELCEQVVCLYSPGRFGAIGLFYDDFGAVSDREVETVLARHTTRS